MIAANQLCIVNGNCMEESGAGLLKDRPRREDLLLCAGENAYEAIPICASSS